MLDRLSLQRKEVVFRSRTAVIEEGARRIESTSFQQAPQPAAVLWSYQGAEQAITCEPCGCPAQCLRKPSGILSLVSVRCNHHQIQLGASRTVVRSKPRRAGRTHQKRLTTLPVGVDEF